MFTGQSRFRGTIALQRWHLQRNGFTRFTLFKTQSLPVILSWFGNMNFSCVPCNTTGTDNNQSHLDTQFLIYFGIRVVQAVVGITGNVLTLIVIYKLKHRVNGHIIMVYLAVTDILVCCILPMSYLRNSTIVDEEHWKNFCAISEYLYSASMIYSSVSYITASIDR